MKNNTRQDKKHISSLFIKCIAAVISVTAVFLAYILWSKGAFLPKWIKWDEKAVTDSLGNYHIVLSNKSVKVEYNNSDMWESPSDIKVQDMLVYDIDNDYYDELVLLVWKIGFYGDAKPFWVSEAESGNDTWSQHLFVYEFNDDRVKPKWMSSYLGPEVSDIIKYENGRHKWIQFMERNGGSALWGWDSWGFSKKSN